MHNRYAFMSLPLSGRGMKKILPTRFDVIPSVKSLNEHAKRVANVRESVYGFIGVYGFIARSPKTSSPFSSLVADLKVREPP